MPNDNEQYHCPEVLDWDGEILVIVAIDHVDGDGNAIVDEEYEHDEAIEAEESGGPVVDPLEPGVVVVDQHRVEHDAEGVGDEHIVDDVRDGLDDVPHIEDPDVVVAQLVELVGQEEVLEQGGHILPNGCHQGQIHGDVEHRRPDPLQLLNETVVQQLDHEDAAGTLITVLANVVEGKPGAIDPPSALPHQLGQ